MRTPLNREEFVSLLHILGDPNERINNPRPDFSKVPEDAAIERIYEFLSPPLAKALFSQLVDLADYGLGKRGKDRIGLRLIEEQRQEIHQSLVINQLRALFHKELKTAGKDETGDSVYASTITWAVLRIVGAYDWMHTIENA